jgi:NAD(P)-dependent dehydrogenase (short-subunit alcohol dehydrogenase family)
MEQDLKNKVAIITGAARGIGKATATLLCQHGAKVAIADINTDTAEDTAQSLSNRSFEAFAITVDVSDIKSIDIMVQTALSKWGIIDILINNAGIIDSNSTLDITEEDWDRVIDINLKGVHLCSQAVAREMVKHRYGRIVNIGSVAGQVGGLKVGPDYSASKAGVICLAKAYARFGAMYGINVNAVAPGFIETDMNRGRDNPSEVPVHRLGTPEDVAKVVYFLVSPLADYVTGTCIDVNGGLLMR